MLRKILSLSILLMVVAAAVPNQAEAQRRAVRRPGVRSVVYVSARPYYPVFYSPFYSPFYWGYGSGWYGWPGWYPYGFYEQYYPSRYRYDNSGAARIDVKPREAQVYVDGYFVGTVDDFDGWLQRLHAPYGEHEVQIYLSGYRTLREKVLFRPGATLKISGTLEPLPAGESAEPKPVPAPGSRPPGERDEYSMPRSRRPAEEYPRQPPRGGQETAGSVAIRVQPGDAEVIIDGERWNAPEGDRLVVQLGEGEHRVEIRKDGYRSFSTSVRVRRGETVPLNVSLSRQEETLKSER